MVTTDLARAVVFQWVIRTYHDTGSDNHDNIIELNGEDAYAETEDNDGKGEIGGAKDELAHTEHFARSKGPWLGCIEGLELCRL